ncbi:hypothetical protein [Streptomyces caelestis]|uniref:hypothetical protein n=1 Tax=Streptomyces caelestis TaxID=36816 RepID=UPI0036F50994
MATLPTVLAVVLAVCAALGNAVATALQRKAALTVPRSQGLRAGLIADMRRRPVWIADILAAPGRRRRRSTRRVGAARTDQGRRAGTRARPGPGLLRASWRDPYGGAPTGPAAVLASGD